MSLFTLHHGDSLAVLPSLAADSIDSCVTDPPYELTTAKRSKPAPFVEGSPYSRHRVGVNGDQKPVGGFMGKEWDGSGIAFNVELWAGVMRALKPGAFLVAFGGTRTYHRMVCAIEDAGFEIRDQLAWVYGQGFPKSSNQEGEWKGWGTALKPAWEPICLARKPLIGTVPANLAVHRTGALNIDGCRVPFAGRDDETEAKEKNRHAEFESGPTENRVFGEFNKPRDDYDAPGRWPANFIHDGSEEVCSAFPAGSNAARFFYCAKASRADREAGLEGFTPATTSDGRAKAIDNAYQRGKTERLNTHPTVKPTALMRHLCRLVTPPGGTIVDPFTGSGTTGRAAVTEGFAFVGIEREAEYAALARARIANAAAEHAPTELEFA